MAVRRLMYELGVLRRYKSPVPLVVVGNITVGGTGKTPLVIYLVEQLEKHGFKPAVISRGYGGQADSYPLHVTQSTSAIECGDEPALIARRTGAPVVVGANREASIKALLSEYDIDVIISDDGLQHLAMQRDIEVCVQDATRQGNNTYLLPAGPYRESPSRLTTFDFVVSNGGSANDLDYTLRLEPGGPRSLSCSVTAEAENHTASVEAFNPRAGVHAVAAIGNPERFFQTCESQGWCIERHAFPDHHRFVKSDICFKDEKPVVMTEKDAVKCMDISDHRHWLLPVDAKLSPDLMPKLMARLVTK